MIPKLLLAILILLNTCGGGNSHKASLTAELVSETSIKTAPKNNVADTDFTPTDWTSETHSKAAAPNFNEVFEDNTVKRIDITVTPARWQSMLADMTKNFGEFGAHKGRPQKGGPEMHGPRGDGPGLRPNGPGPNQHGGKDLEAQEDPIMVPAEVIYNNKEWYRVGVRFKGNSSLRSSWNAGNLKLPFKLVFDAFEDDYPQIKNQRFYGFKKLSLKNNYDDKSMLREKVAGDVFRNAGLVGSHTAFYTLYVDYGEGPQYFGVYTLVEEVDDTVIETQFSDNSGNLYKPNGPAASFAKGSFNTKQYVKKTNKKVANYNDVESLLTILHDETRATDAAAWRTNLETVFDTDVFLKYLAVNTAIQNWDTYGNMTHNYYLYNNPETKKLTWIPWDNNEALGNGKNNALQLDFKNVKASEWPLIGYLYQDEVYKEKYNTYVKEVLDGPFEVSKMESLYSSYANLIEPYANKEEKGFTFLNSNTEFYTAIHALKVQVGERANINDYIN